MRQERDAVSCGILSAGRFTGLGQDHPLLARHAPHPGFVCGAVVSVTISKGTGLRGDRGETAVTVVHHMTSCAQDDTVIHGPQPCVRRPVFVSGLCRNYMVSVLLQKREWILAARAERVLPQQGI